MSNYTGRTTPPHERTCPFSQYAPQSASLSTGATPTPDLCSHSSTTPSDNQSTRSHSPNGSHPAPSETRVESDEGGAPKAKFPTVYTQEIDEDLLRTSLEDRIAYLTDFLGFTSRDAEIIHRAAPLVNGLIPDMVDGMYEKLFEFDITKRVFMNRNQGFDGPLPKRLDDLTLDSAQITFRKVFMKSWARRVLTADYSKSGTWAFMDKVGIMHTGVSSFKHQRALGIAPLNVPYRDCALMLGWVCQVLQSGILQVQDDQLSPSEKIEACAAVNKVIWIQNDLFSRHYIKE